MINNWPKKETEWIKDRTLFVSIPFTWRLPKVKVKLRQRSFFWDNAIVGGPAVSLMPEYFTDMEYVSVGHKMPGVLQRVNPLATKTSAGCVRKCKFCAVPETEGKLIEFKDWPDLPVLIDNNLLATSKKHFNRVIDRLKKFDFVDFNQGLDSRLLTKHHAGRFAELKNPILRLALDNMNYSDEWIKAYEILRKSGHTKKNIRSYALIGFNSSPDEAWKRCEFIESFGIKVLPMWYHTLEQEEVNIVSKKQKKLRWSEEERKLIMGYFYRHMFKKTRKEYYNNAMQRKKRKGQV